jgi:hypothetical protein
MMLGIETPPVKHFQKKYWKSLRRLGSCCLPRLRVVTLFQMLRWSYIHVPETHPWTIPAAT